MWRWKKLDSSHVSAQRTTSAGENGFPLSVVGSLRVLVCLRTLTEQSERDRVAAAARYLPEWDRGELPEAPRFRLYQMGALIGPGLLMVGSTIGGGEWMFGPIVTARYGGIVMWIAAVSVALQAVFNLSVMRYALYTGEPIFVGLLRTFPGPKFWIVFYLIADSGYIWPYVASNAAVPVAAAWLGRLPGPQDDFLVRVLGYAIFLSCFIPLIFGGKVYTAVERFMTAKVIFVLGFLLAVDLFLVSGETWWAVFSGFFKVGMLPEGEVDWATLAAFAAVAGVGGLSNTLFSNYARDKGWGMGALVGAIPSLIGGKKIALSPVGKVFDVTPESLKRWKAWLGYIRRDQIWIWAAGSLIGMALPSMLSLEFLRGAEVEGHAAAAMTARGIADRHGEVFWFLTLLCGFVVLGIGFIQTLDGIVRRWTDVLWSASGRLRAKGGQVKNIYYVVLLAYCLWGLLALRLTPNPLVLAIVSSVCGNVGLGSSALHTLFVNRRLMPPELRLPWYMQLGLVGAFVFFLGISGVALHQHLTAVSR